MLYNPQILNPLPVTRPEHDEERGIGMMSNIALRARSSLSLGGQSSSGPDGGSPPPGDGQELTKKIEPDTSFMVREAHISPLILSSTFIHEVIHKPQRPSYMRSCMVPDHYIILYVYISLADQTLNYKPSTRNPQTLIEFETTGHHAQAQASDSGLDQSLVSHIGHDHDNMGLLRQVTANNSFRLWKISLV